MGLLLGAMLGAATSISAQTKPNVLILFADDMGWGDLAS